MTVDFKDQIKQLGDRINKLKGQVATEEATKSAFVMPMLQVLGYDVFNPLEIVPEFTADIGIKKGEKIDYAILRDGKTLILIECKHWEKNLNLHEGQLLRYFQAANARFGVLTNGIKYRFYTDLDKPNIMDEKPFFEFDATEMKENQIEELKKFHKSYFDLDNIVNTASDLKYTAEIKSLIQNEMSNPSEWFVRGIAKVVYQGMVTSKVLEQFTALTKKSFSQVISDTITDRLKNALREEESVQPPTAAASEASPPVEPESLIVTTPEELEGFYTVRAALRDVVSMDRIVYRDTQTYFGILLDDNNRKPICRLYFNGVKKYIATFDDNKKEVRHEMTKMDDIFKHTEAMTESIRHYENPIKPVKPVESSATDVEPIADTAM
ncbi:MAG TPA: restriction endonuclease [Planctomycetaceae bacterium]|nr:restriction endonuclease [Planctomycetaceae bacterium]